MAFLLVVFFASLAFLAGCGGGGYPGASLTSVSASSLTLDAGQSVTVSASTSGNLPLSWTLSGTSCAGAACGTLSVTEGTSTTYTAPAGLSGALSVSLQAGISGTTASKTVQITVNPDAVISTPPPAGTQGVAYTTTFSVQGGTAPFRKSIVSGILPAGLTFNAATGSVSGTPTVNGTFNVVVQFVDTSDVPYTATATESFLINAPASSSGSGSGGSGSGGTGTGGTGTGGTGTGGTGTGAALAVADVALPPGTVGLNYSASLQATGGVAPYTWSVVAGALPTGLSLDTGTGIVSGMPVAAGNFPSPPR